MRRIEASTAGPGRTVREAFNRALAELGRERPEIVLLDADNASSTTELIFADANPAQFLQMGVAEQNMVGVAAGLSSMGFVPFVSSYACFQVYRAHDQIRILVAQTGLPVRLVGQSAGVLTGLTGKTHQSIDDIAVMRAMPGMTIVNPADEFETREVVRWAVDYDRPLYLRLGRGTSRLVFDEAYRFEFGTAVSVRDGRDIAIVSSGMQTGRVLAAVPLLVAAGLDAMVVHVPTMKPIDADAIEEAARLTGRVVTVEDHTVIGGLGGAVCEVLAERYPVHVHRIGIEDTYMESAQPDSLLEKYGLSPEAVARSIIAWTAGSAR